MTVQLAPWILLGGFGLLLCGLFVTVLARGMEKKDATAAKTPEQEMTETVDAIAGAFPEGSSVRGLMKKYVFAKPGDAAAHAEAAKATAKKTGGTLAAVFGGLAALGVGGGVLSDILDRPGPSAASIVPIELSAGDLHGTLLMPRKKSSIVLIVPGSGPTDRDGNNPLGVKANSYKLLAEALAEEDIGTVRVDKRGMFGSAAAGDPNAATVEAYAKDYGAWIDTVRAQTKKKCIFLLGHSEGALMVSAAAAGRKDVCGLILVSGMGRPMGEVMRQQLRANPANAAFVEGGLSALSELEAGRHVDVTNLHPALQQAFAPQVQGYLISVLKVDPVETLRRANKRTLIVQGTTDLQVTVEDARLLDKVRRTTLEIIDGMNHVLKEAPADRGANLATYVDPSLPLHPQLAREIRRFVKDDD